MAKVLGKKASNIYWMRFLKPGQTPWSILMHDETLKDKNTIDIGWLNVKYYDGWYTNEHHITFESYYKLILPFMSKCMENFNFNIEDFKLVEKYSKDKKFNVSYLVPKDTNLKFSFERNGEKIFENKGFGYLHDMKTKRPEDEGLFLTEYHEIFRGTHTCCIVRNETIDSDRSIFISGDSMMAPIIPILACYYKEVVFMDNRDGKSHKDYYEDKMFDDIIIQMTEGISINKELSTNLQ